VKAGEFWGWEHHDLLDTDLEKAVSELMYGLCHLKEIEEDYRVEATADQERETDQERESGRTAKIKAYFDVMDIEIQETLGHLQNELDSRVISNLQSVKETQKFLTFYEMIGKNEPFPDGPDKLDSYEVSYLYWITKLIEKQGDGKEIRFSLNVPTGLRPKVFALLVQNLMVDEPLAESVKQYGLYTPNTANCPKEYRSTDSIVVYTNEIYKDKALEGIQKAMTAAAVPPGDVASDYIGWMELATIGNKEVANVFTGDDTEVTSFTRTRSNAFAKGIVALHRLKLDCHDMDIDWVWKFFLYYLKQDKIDNCNPARFIGSATATIEELQDD